MLCPTCEQPKSEADFNRWTKQKCYDCLREYDRQRYPKKKAQQQKYNRNRLYGLSEERFDALWVSQKGRCPICEVEMLREGRFKNSVVVDHCHATKRVRGLLCCECNQAIGKLHDSPSIARRAAVYLERP